MQLRKSTDVYCKLGKLSFSMLAFVLIMCFYSVAVGQTLVKNESISLRSENVFFTPEKFYIAQVVDERTERKGIGYLLSPRSNSSQPIVTHTVDLEGGAEASVSQFVQKSLPQNKALTPIVIRIKECMISESPGTNGLVEGRVVLTMSFDLLRGEERIHLIDYRRGGAHYNRSANVNSHVAVEKALRQSLMSALRYLDNWMNQEAGGHISLAKGIKVSFTDFSDNFEDDTVFYATDRPLTWNDFRERPRLERYAASVFPGFAYESRSRVVNGILHINITMRVYVLPEYSWVKDHARDAYSLNHEQRHFDIAKLIAERFKQKLHPDSLTVEDYNSMIQWNYIDSYREMNHLQEQYDHETQHGTNQAAQARWNKRIDEELRSFGIKENSI